MENMKTLIVIPARYASTRFPGKPLARLGGESIIGRVWHTAALMAGAGRVVVATDDERILTHVRSIGGDEAAMMTSTAHRSGTDRCGEVLRRLKERGEEYDVVVNIQGDEPFVEQRQIEALTACFADGDCNIATLRTPIRSTAELLSPNNVKVVCGDNGQALYFSRQPIPYRRDVAPEAWLDGAAYYKHVGIYAFRGEVLEKLCTLPPAPLEECEKLEQLRWLSAGYRITVRDTEHANIGIDTPEDLAEAEAWLAQHQK